MKTISNTNAVKIKIKLPNQTINIVNTIPVKGIDTILEIIKSHLNNYTSQDN